MSIRILLGYLYKSAEVLIIVFTNTPSLIHIQVTYTLEKESNYSKCCIYHFLCMCAIIQVMTLLHSYCNFC